MSRKERGRLEVLSRVRDGEMKLTEAKELLRISYRQTRRIHQRYVREGDQGLVHRSRGRQSNRAKPLEVKERALASCRDRYKGFGPTLASEMIKEREGCEVAPETLRRWLLAAGLWHKQRKRPHHRQRRERKGHFGELVQLDGSHHKWFEDRGPKACLMNMVDDATGRTLAVMSHEETTVAAMEVLGAWVDKYGIPQALYVDWKNVYLTKRDPTLEEQLRGELPLTHFGKACQKLGIEIIPASSPQAKGRVERKHEVYQDRWVKEMRLEGISEVDSANWLLPEFSERLNDKFAVPPRSNTDFHRLVGEGLDLREVFCFEESRTVSNDWVLRYNNRLLQIIRQSPLPPAKSRVLVRKYLDGSLHLMYRGNEVDFTEIHQPSPQPKDSALNPPRPKIPRRPPIPTQDHPWRKPFLRRAGATP